MKDKTLSDVIGHYETEPLSNEYYEKLYKIEGREGQVFRYVSNNKDDSIFRPFDEDDDRYWIEDTPKLVRML